ncbi:uncharacterized protein [Apostichopus japonicus]|uniref:uncharacterized protein n=1 Tax=Stichopus japonicus TaxID=307972 RepID=UPI003AB88B89
MTSKAPRFSDDRQILSEEATWVKCEKSSDQTSFHRWIFALLFGVIVIVITVQQYQLMTIQRELNILNQFEEASTMIGAENFTGDTQNNKNETIQGFQSRRKRYIQPQMMVPLVHLRGRQRNGYGIFYWTSNNEGSSGHTGVELIEINDAVKAIRVLCSGWYYVYAQVPYKQTESYSVTTGHKIIRREKCGRSNEEVVLQTSVTLDGRTPHSIPQDVKYLGGIVHLTGSSQVEVRPIDHENALDNAEVTEHAHFGLFLIKHHDQMECFQMC